MFDNKIVLITGGTGSFGKNFAQYLLNNTKLKKLIIFSRDELKQSVMKKDIHNERVRFFIGDIRDLQRLERAFNDVDIIIHAAALKQVDTLEYNPFEAVKTNIIGSQNVIEAAINQGVKKVLLVSTDKAAQPVNLYGSTKLCAEKLFVDGNSYSSHTRFSCVRYGNVIGSRGSIIETLIQKENIDTVFITDERMTRFWITLEQSFSLVSFALEYMSGGEIFIPKIPSMRLVDIFDALAPNAKRKVIGIRPGEKVHEVLLTKEESRHSYDIGDYFVVLPECEEFFDIKKEFKAHIEKGTPLPPDFSYTSDTNTQWMRQDDLLSYKEKRK